MRPGYRNPDKDFNIESDTEQFNFSLNHNHLIFPMHWTISEKLAPVERVNIYLSDKRLIKNIFIVNGELAYYYERDSYLRKSDPREDVIVPDKNIMNYFEFKAEDVVCILAVNNPSKAKFDPWYWLAIYKYNQFDSLKSIRKNIFYSVGNWTRLPLQHSDILYINNKYNLT